MSKILITNLSTTSHWWKLWLISRHLQKNYSPTCDLLY